jgi:hypothetical protein
MLMPGLSEESSPLPPPWCDDWVGFHASIQDFMRQLKRCGVAITVEGNRHSSMRLAQPIGLAPSGQGQRRASPRVHGE